MKNLEKNELMIINGGASISAAFISSLARGINTIMDLGRALGTSIRRIGSNNICSF
ncbi:MAG: hypothetical protein J6D28_01865 [Bacilli bacterium]|nr:hypothetical protein [Bacilli bacterium]